MICFNSRAHGGRDTLVFLSAMPSMVSIHAPTGGATKRADMVLASSPVSIHAPTGGATCFGVVSRSAREFQFTRPRGARRLEFVECVEFGDVSIHAPTGGATCRRSGSWRRPARFQFTRPRGARPQKAQLTLSRQVSIHAPTGGATVIDAHVVVAERFNSRAHGGRDMYPPDWAERPVVVSIHAPTGGATEPTGFPSPPSWFQFTRPRGARPSRRGCPCGHCRFQFTRPRGARPLSTPPGGPGISFNSRAHGGRDPCP